MKIKTREEYIAKKNAKEKKYLKKINSENFKKARARHIDHVCKRAVRVLTRRINRVDTFVEPREIDFNFDIFECRNFNYEASDFYPIFEALTKTFDYLKIDLTWNCPSCHWLTATVQLKKD